MKTAVVTLIALLTSTFFFYPQAQITVREKSVTINKVEKLEAKKEEIRKEEKAELKEEIITINEQLEEGEITPSEADELKKEAAEKHAENIEDKLNIIDSKIALLQRNEGEDKTVVSIGLEIGNNKEEETEMEKNGNAEFKHTISSPFIAFGLSNAIPENGGLDDSPFKIWGSRFFTIGYEFTTSLADFMRVKYGLAFQFTGLKPDDNLYFVQIGEETHLEKYPLNLEKSKFRNDNLVLPVHLEFGPTDIVQDGDESYYSTDDSFKFGFGGFIGLNLNTIQKLKFDEDGKHRKVKISKSFNTTNFLYGLSAYIGYDWFNLYARYNINPIFTDNPVEQQMVALGLRFTM